MKIALGKRGTAYQDKMLKIVGPKGWLFKEVMVIWFGWWINKIFMQKLTIGLYVQ